MVPPVRARAKDGAAMPGEGLEPGHAHGDRVVVRDQPERAHAGVTREGLLDALEIRGPLRVLMGRPFVSRWW